MTKSEQNKFSMYRAIESILEDFKESIDAKPMLKDSTDNFKKVLQEFMDKDNTYLNVKKGTTADKESAEEKLIEELMVKAGVLFVHARKTDNGNLKALSQVTRSGLQQLRDPELLQKAKSILENFRDNLEELKKSGMTDQSLTDLEGVVKNYEDAVNKKDSKQAEGKASRKDLKDLFSEVDDILKNDLDRLIEMVRTDNADFYNRYKAARSIKDLGQPRTKTEEKKEGNS
jgi:hypothetical protein